MSLWFVFQGPKMTEAQRRFMNSSLSKEQTIRRGIEAGNEQERTAPKNDDVDDEARQIETSASEKKNRRVPAARRCLVSLTSSLRRLEKLTRPWSK